jgi:hypothetical protein
VSITSLIGVVERAAIKSLMVVAPTYLLFSSWKKITSISSLSAALAIVLYVAFLTVVVFGKEIKCGELTAAALSAS